MQAGHAVNFDMTVLITTRVLSNGIRNLQNERLYIYVQLQDLIVATNRNRIWKCKVRVSSLSRSTCVTRLSSVSQLTAHCYSITFPISVLIKVSLPEHLKLFLSKCSQFSDNIDICYNFLFKFQKLSI
jgi:hypothetical protein